MNWLFKIKVGSTKLTSAVKGMSVTEMRKCLAEVRQLLNVQNVNEPFLFSKILSNGMEIWEFVHLVANGLHCKRTQK